MDEINPRRQRNESEEEEFEDYVERQFVLLNERLEEMSVDIAGLEVDEQTLATVIPELATQLTTLQTTNATDEAALKTAISDKEAAVAAAAGDATALAIAQADLAKAEGELAQVGKVKAALDPIVAQASTLIPATPAPAPAGETVPAPAGVAAADAASAADGTPASGGAAPAGGAAPVGPGGVVA